MTTTKRTARPALSAEGQAALADYAHSLHQEADFRPATIRNYLSDVQQFIAWCEEQGRAGNEAALPFTPQRVATPSLTRYRDYLQHSLDRKPATINRILLSLKRYFAWATATERMARNPAQVVKSVTQTPSPPRHLSDQEENALLAALEANGSLRDRALIILMLHTGLRVSEVCYLKRVHLHLAPRSGQVEVWGKRNRYRAVPLNSSTVRKCLALYLDSLPPTQTHLFASRRTHSHLTPRAVGFLLAKYAQRAGISNLHPHDLRHRFGYRMVETVPLHRLAQLMGHDSLDTTLLYTRGTLRDLQRAVETIAWE